MYQKGEYERKTGDTNKSDVEEIEILLKKD